MQNQVIQGQGHHIIEGQGYLWSVKVTPGQAHLMVKVISRSQSF